MCLIPCSVYLSDVRLYHDGYPSPQTYLAVSARLFTRTRTRFRTGAGVTLRTGAVFPVDAGAAGGTGRIVVAILPPGLVCLAHLLEILLALLGRHPLKRLALRLAQRRTMTRAGAGAAGGTRRIGVGGEGGNTQASQYDGKNSGAELHGDLFLVMGSACR